MKVIIAGSRSVVGINLDDIIAESGFEITQVVSGGALQGVDRIGEQWARSNSIDCKVFEPDWAQYGKAAGPIRNREMAKYADALIAVWDGESKGTKNMIETARHLLLPTFVHYVNEEGF